MDIDTLWSLFENFAGVFVLAVICLTYYVRRWRRFRKSAYGKLTGNSFAKTETDRGLYGEYLLCREVEACFDDPDMLMNVYVPRGDLTTSECDLVLVDRSGVWVFENKNYSGWIFGNGSRQTWTQTLNRFTKNHFYNPMWQDFGHVRALSAYLGLPEGSFVPVVVFSDRCELKEISGCACPVIHTRDVRGTVARISAERGDVLTDEKMRDIMAKLEPLTHASDQVKKRHTEQVRAAKSSGKRM